MDAAGLCVSLSLSRQMVFETRFPVGRMAFSAFKMVFPACKLFLPARWRRLRAFRLKCSAAKAKPEKPIFF